jgi:hypothetical protein
VLEHLRAEGELERLRRERQPFQVGAVDARRDPRAFRSGRGDADDPPRDVDAGDAAGRPAGERGEIAAIAAARVEERVDRQLREKQLPDALELPVERRVWRGRRRGVLQRRAALVDVSQRVRGRRF